MLVKNVMTTKVMTCDAGTTLERAVQLMWEGDFGAIPVVDGHNHLLGILTDRDACMAAYTQGRALAAISVASAMAHQVHTCNAEDSVTRAEEIMRHGQVHRLPAVNNLGELVGIVSLSDLARCAVEDGHSGAPRPAEVTRTLAAVCRPRPAPHEADTAGKRRPSRRSAHAAG